MTCSVENGMLILEIDGQTYSFEAHGEPPRPSLFNISAAGKHWSDRDPEVPLEKHTGIQEVIHSNGLVAWYTQEFLPDGSDYKFGKKAFIYVGDLITGEHRQVYKGECYGDMEFYDGMLYFNTGNKVAVIDLDTDECTILFKHSNIKKNFIRLRVTDKRIFYTHWTKDKTNLMWFDRGTGEIVNPHIDSVSYYLLDDDTIVFGSVSHTWLFDLNTMKKKRFFTNKTVERICTAVCQFFGVPSEHYGCKYDRRDYGFGDPYIDLREMKDGRLYFKAVIRFWEFGADIAQRHALCLQLGVPDYIHTLFSCLPDGSGIRLEHRTEDIYRIDKQDGTWSLSGIKEERQN